MPKRLCAIATADSESTILLADKFGDVYSVPLLPAPEELAALTTPAAASAVAPTAAQLAKAERDRLAAEKRKRTEISLDLPFTHTLLLGHVSMLIDIVSVTVPGPQDAKPRTYVLTADRDEHIRVSRYPQGHVIEGFCLGHESFVSKLLIPTWDATTLVSGGGDDFLLLWDWRSGKALQRVDVGDLVAGVVGRKVAGGKLDQGEASADKAFKVTVVGLWEVPSLRQVLVAFER
jgi:tRNA (guanine-N(7)-)-methyltransferase subunit TRM82